MQIIELNDSSFDKENIQELLSKKICLVGVFSKSCVHCTNMKPQWKILKNKLQDSKCNAVLLEIDSDQLNYIDYSELTNSVNGLPSIMVFKNGGLVKEFNGNRVATDMFKFFKPYLVLVGTGKRSSNRLKKSVKGLKRLKKTVKGLKRLRKTGKRFRRK